MPCSWLSSSWQWRFKAWQSDRSVRQGERQGNGTPPSVPRIWPFPPAGVAFAMQLTPPRSEEVWFPGACPIVLIDRVKCAKALGMSLRLCRKPHAAQPPGLHGRQLLHSILRQLCRPRTSRRSALSWAGEKPPFCARSSLFYSTALYYAILYYTRLE